MKHITKTSLITMVVVLTAIFSSAYAQSSCCGEGASMAKMEKSVDTKSAKNNSDKGKSSIVRTGVINVKAIDANKDGKVFQDMMDWNVISDKPGKCPLCKMTLKEVSIKVAEDNLTKNGFKIKK